LTSTLHSGWRRAPSSPFALLVGFGATHTTRTCPHSKWRSKYSDLLGKMRLDHSAI
jgi:hypothetical protein